MFGSGTETGLKVETGGLENRGEVCPELTPDEVTGIAAGVTYLLAVVCDRAVRVRRRAVISGVDAREERNGEDVPAAGPKDAAEFRECRVQIRDVF